MSVHSLLRRTCFGIALAALTLPGVPTFAEPLAYTTVGFEEAQTSGKPVLVHVTAPWCSVCAAQKPILSKLEAEPRFKALQVFDVDFDHQKEAVQSFGARMQSTLIVYRDGKEVGRSAGETKPEAIEALLDKAV